MTKKQALLTILLNTVSYFIIKSIIFVYDKLPEIMKMFLQFLLKYYDPGFYYMVFFAILNFTIMFIILRRNKKTDKPKKQKQKIDLWLTGEDVLKDYSISRDKLVQYIYNGLNVYPRNDDAMALNDFTMQPLSDHDLLFLLNDYDFDKSRFKKSDIEDFIKNKT